MFSSARFCLFRVLPLALVAQLLALVAKPTPMMPRMPRTPRMARTPRPLPQAR